MAAIIPSNLRTWFDVQLGGIRPDWMNAMFFGNPIAKRALLVKEGYRVEHRAGMIHVPLICATESDANQRTETEVATVDLFVPSDYFLKRTISAPTKAFGSINAVAILDLQRRTPFTMNDVHVCLTDVKSDKASAIATQWVGRKSDVDKWRQNLANSGLNVRRILVKHGDKATLLAEFTKEIAPNAAKWRALNAILFTISVILALVIWLYPAWAIASKTQDLGVKASDLKSRAVEMRMELNQLKLTAAASKKIVNATSGQSTLTSILVELTNATADGTWIDNLSYTPESVVLTAETDGSSADVALQLSKVKAFSNPRISGPVSRTALGSERFRLTFELGAGS